MICNNRGLPTPGSPAPCAGRAATWLGWLAAGTVLLGCGSVKSFDAAEPQGENFAGTWRLNVAASDDPRKELEKLRPRRMPPGSYGGQQQEARRRRGQQPGQGSQQDSTGVPDDLGGPELMRPSPIPLIPNADVLRNEVLSIKQRPDAFVIDYGVTVRSYTPGLKSVVSVPGGVGDQSTGWSGKDYVIDIRSQLGLEMTQKFSISNKNGRQLIVKIHLSGTGFPTIQLTRVYDPTNAETPRSLPSLE